MYIISQKWLTYLLRLFLRSILAGVNCLYFAITKEFNESHFLHAVAGLSTRLVPPAGKLKQKKIPDYRGFSSFLFFSLCAWPVASCPFVQSPFFLIRKQVHKKMSLKVFQLQRIIACTIAFVLEQILPEFHKRIIFV